MMPPESQIKQHQPILAFKSRSKHLRHQDNNEAENPWTFISEDPTASHQGPHHLLISDMATLNAAQKIFVFNS